MERYHAEVVLTKVLPVEMTISKLETGNSKLTGLGVESRISIFQLRFSKKGQTSG